MKAAFFDVDGTLTKDRVWKGWMDYFRVHRIRMATHFAFLLVHYPLYVVHRIGFLARNSFRSHWAAHLAWYVRGFSTQEGESVWPWIIENYLADQWRADVRDILDRHRGQGDVVLLVSSGPVPLLRHIGLNLGVDHVIGTQFETRDGRYTGRAIKPICIARFKAIFAQKYLRDQGISVDLPSSTTYADSTTDLELLEMVGHPVATYPDDALRNVARSRQWTIYP